MAVIVSTVTGCTRCKAFAVGTPSTVASTRAGPLRCELVPHLDPVLSLWAKNLAESIPGRWPALQP